MLLGVILILLDSTGFVEVLLILLESIGIVVALLKAQAFFFVIRKILVQLMNLHLI